MAIREVVLGGIAGQMLIAAYNWLVGRKRQYGLEQGARHEPEDAEMSLSAIFAEGGVAGKHYAAMVAYPELCFYMMSVERVIVLSDTNPEMKPGTRKVVGLVILRCEDGGPWHRDTGAWRLKATLEAAYADNGNTFRHVWTVEPLKVPAREDIELSEACGGIISNDDE